MKIGERKFVNPTVLVPPWSPSDGSGDNTSFALSPNGKGGFNGDELSLFLQNEAMTALQRYLPSNADVEAYVDGEDEEVEEFELPGDVYACDNFRMFEFKVRKCARGRSHDWTECPFAHPGEKARRRDPRRYHYAGASCPDFRKGFCKKGDACEFAHGVFECWLHPARYRTQPCKDGVNCTRRVCFFAHTPSQLRVLSPSSTESYDGSPRRSKGLSFLSAVNVDSPAVESPPVSPIGSSLSRSLGSNSVNELVASLHQLHLNKVKSIPKSWGLQMGSNSSGLSSPRRSVSMTRPGFCSLPSTPTRAVTRSGFGYVDHWDRVWSEDDPVMERVESGRDLRVRMFEKLSKENLLGRVDPDASEGKNPDVEWVSELVK